MNEIITSIFRGENKIEGTVLSKGHAKGLLVKAHDVPELFGKAYDDSVERGFLSEKHRYIRAIELLDKQLVSEIQQLQTRLESQHWTILEAHRYMLKDPDLLKDIERQIVEYGLNAEDGIKKAFWHKAQQFIQLGEEEFLSFRSSDINELSQRLIAILSQPQNKTRIGKKKFLVYASELYTTWVLNAHESGVCGFIVQEGTPLSHACILARALGVPVLKIESDEYLAADNKIDAYLCAQVASPYIILKPNNRIDELGVPEKECYSTRKKSKHLPINIWLNFFDPLQTQHASYKSVTGIGLFRTEYFFMRSDKDFPDENEQTAYYSKIFDVCEKKPVVIRTLDVGGDKNLPYFSLGPQENPYLGLRGQRLYRYHPDIFITQIRAILRASHGLQNIRILYPMIETVDDILYLKELYSFAQQSLEKDNIIYNTDAQQGIMIEVPSVAWSSGNFLKHVDFASVGTNDLLQYFFAVDRNNANVFDRFTLENPSALAMLRRIVEDAAGAGKPLNLCGEIASDIYQLPLIIGLGFTDISIDLHAIESVMITQENLFVSECSVLVDNCLKCDTSKEVTQKVDEFWKQHGKIYKRNTMRRGSRIKDPVCGMQLNANDHHLSSVRNGKRYYFCTPRCMEKFLDQKICVNTEKQIQSNPGIVKY